MITQTTERPGICRDCAEHIWFKEGIVTSKGRHVPLSRVNGKLIPHTCSGGQFSNNNNSPSPEERTARSLFEEKLTGFANSFVDLINSELQNSKLELKTIKESSTD
jgi:hypothetical protein